MGSRRGSFSEVIPKVSLYFIAFGLAIYLPLANHSALEECADVLRPGSPCGVTRGVGEGGRSAPGATGSRDECTGAPQTAVTGSRVYGR